MKFNAQQYMECSSLRIQSARRLHADCHFSAAIYLAGVGIECLLRAYIMREDPTFDERHDLQALLTSSRLGALVNEADRKQIAAWLMDVWSRWKNNYRYASDERLKTEFKKLALHRGITGDYLKENSRLVVEAALQLQLKGAKRWILKKK